ncbi:MAG: murein biosynthesis integral membrane protein MurJ [Acidobacteriota bacterium]
MSDSAHPLPWPRIAPRPRVAQAVLSLGAAGLAVKFAAWTREMVLAGFFGRSDAMDAFLAALLIPNLLVNLLGESMNQALIPTLVRVRLQQGRARAQDLLSSSMTLVVAGVAAAALLMALLAHLAFPLLASGFSPAKLALSVHLFYVLVPMVLFSAIAGNCAAVLNSTESFAVPALAALIVPATTILVVLALHSPLGIWSVALGCVAGTAFHAGTMAAAMPASGYVLRLRWQRASPDLREVLRQYGAVFLSSIVASAGLLVDQAMAAMLPAGSISALVYGGRFVSVIVSLLGGAISAALVPYLSAMVARRDWPACRAALRRWPRIAALVSVPLAVVAIAGASGIVRLTLQRGAFGAGDTAAVARVLAMYAIQIPFYVVSRIFYRFVLAMRRADLVLACGTINLALDVVLNILLMRTMGAAGIALATSLWSVTTCALFAFWAHRLLARAETDGAPSADEVRA